MSGRRNSIRLSKKKSDGEDAYIPPLNENLDDEYDQIVDGLEKDVEKQTKRKRIASKALEEATEVVTQAKKVKTTKTPKVWQTSEAALAKV